MTDADDTPTAVAPCPLADGFAVTLLCGGRGWDFYGWTCDGGQPVTPQPTAEEIAMRFASVEAAGEYFKARYAGKLRAA